MKELKSSVGLGGKPGEGGEEVRQDEDDDEDHDKEDDDEDNGNEDGDEEDEEEDNDVYDCCFRWRVQPLDLILNL